VLVDALILDTRKRDKRSWDDDTWFQAERYLLDNLSLPAMLEFVDLAGCERTSGGWTFKTEAVKALRHLPPRDVLRTWDAWRTRR
jgi:hypothetical protein